MTLDFEQRFYAELVALRALFGYERVEDSLVRLKEIHEYTEAKWQTYAHELRDGVVRYVLIAEAPPWSQEGPIQYMFDPASRVGPYMGALRQAFPGANLGSAKEALKVLAAHGFLLLDSSPFAMDYSSKRSSGRYDALIRQTVKSYLQAKIEDSALTWSPGIRVAFAVCRNARSILKAVTQFSFGGCTYPISSHLIAVNRAWYPDASKLRNIYGLDGGRTA